ncbi:protein of unknown function (DUF4333) [Nocardia amikacinitolerans]|uniref:DUF4333 domain-containing protein n=1 Tax=Nocardia amikacinitolerans TaxID=756689 RepID=UPI000834B45F|nr:DUF4333 domain-containing protein [Nocardia amikacinitolerans]MCP2316076.1 protein of unknown function (DUF4333) [Nocardia amikacinitolerans]
MKTTTLAGLFALAFLAAGCSVEVGSSTPQVKEGELEKSVKQTLTEEVGQEPDSIDCPADLDGKVGTTMRCTLTAGGETLGLTVTVTSVEGDKVNYDVAVDPA